MSSRFQRFLLPGFAFKAVVIGGGYATGRELAEFFLPSGPWGGIAAMLLAMLIWSIVCVATFLFARLSGARDYLTFVRALLGPGWIAFEVAYLLFVVLILAVFGAAAGAIAEATFGVPRILGATRWRDRAGRNFPAICRWSSSLNTSHFCSTAYVLFVILSLTHFGAVSPPGIRTVRPCMAGSGRLAASYNIIGAVVICRCCAT
jgi:hypothetical protein